MRNLIYLIIRYSALVVFILLECLSFYLIVNYNRSQKEIWSHSSNLFTGGINKRMENIQNYFSLQVQNDSLLSENARLREQIINYRVASKENAFQEFESTDTLRKYHLIPVGVCGKTLNLRNNYFTLCKGRAAGIRPGMGVISDKGIVGIVKTVSNHFSTVLLLTNSQSRISARIKDSNYPGTIVWNNSNPRIVNLIEVPRHAVVEIGDSIVSSGYSISFAPDVFIGRIADFKIHEGNSNYSIDVELSEDLSALDFVYVIDYHYIEEKSNQLELENVNEIELDCDALVKAIGNTIFATSNDELRLAMTGVLMQLDFNKVIFVSTDAHKLVKYTIGGLTSELTESVIIPKKCLTVFKNAVSVLDDEKAKVAFNSKNIFFKAGDTLVISRLIDAKFPDYNAVIPVNNDKNLSLSRSDFQNSLKRIVIYSNKTTNQVVLNLAEDSLTVSAQDLDFSNEATEQISCSYKSDPMTIGFNAKFLVEMLGVIDTDEVILELSAPNKAGILLPSEQNDQEKLMMLVMPVMMSH